MPFLPLDHGEPFSATLGVMLYPAMDEFDPPRARAFAVQYLAEPVRRFLEAGHSLTFDALANLFLMAGHPLLDLHERWEGGLATGDLFKTLYMLAKNQPSLASWENAVKIVEKCASRLEVKGRRTDLLKHKKRFLTVAHLWAAWSIRDGEFSTRQECGYDGYIDFQAFLAESEILRDFGQNWRPARRKSTPPLPREVWRVPHEWKPLPSQVGWPRTGVIPDIVMPEEFLAGLRPAGRPRR